MTDDGGPESTRRMGIRSGAIVGGAGEGLARLVVLMGPEPGRRFTLRDQPFVIGRSEDCDIQLDDSKVSRRHVRIRTSKGRWIAEDLGSRNGTLINGETLEAGRPLEVGDRIQLSAETLLLFTRQDPLEDLLLHRQQMEIIGHLAAGIAHDFNNLLNVVEASSSQLRALPPSTPLGDPVVAECHADIRAASRRAAELTAKLLAIAGRRDGGESGDEVDVSALAADVLQLARRTLGASIALDAHVDRGLLVRGDYAALHQVLMNLCINARDAMPDGGTIKLRAVKSEDAEHVEISVGDTGVGMDEETRARVFEPFFTTKARGAGSGLGLSTVYEVATSHGGEVEVDSKPGAGSTFRIRLPLAGTRPPSVGAHLQRRASTWDGGDEAKAVGRVLVVDDQELVRRSLGRLLSSQGHHVLYAADGLDAVERYRDTDPRPDVVLMDLDMPRMSGDEALVRIRELDAHANVVLISGFFEEGRRAHLLAQGALDLLGKPVDLTQLEACIRTALGGDQRRPSLPE